jgi:3-methyladenine DNA glycosylase AlkD
LVKSQQDKHTPKLDICFHEIYHMAFPWKRTMTLLAQAIQQRLRALADPDKAIPMRAYLLNQFDFLGLPAPVRRGAVQDLIVQAVPDARAMFDTAGQLWELKEREFRYTAIDLLRRHHRKLTKEDLPEIQRLLLRDPWWETVDGLAAVIGEIVYADRSAQTIMDQWLQHQSFWVRRAAMLHQLGWRLETDTARLGRYAMALAHEDEFFIRKAIGWALRDYARWNPTFVGDFVAANRNRLSSLTVREACKNLTARA